MLSPRRVFLIVCVTVLGGVHARAFSPPIHDGITRAAIAAAVARVTLPTTQLRRGFTPAALQEIADANRATDTGDCGSRRPDDPARTCVIDGSEEYASLMRLLRKEAPAAEHFDGEQIQEGSNLIYENVRLIHDHLAKRRFTAARKVLGSTLHTLQDFYAHTNWVELGNRAYESRLGRELDAFKEGARPRLALPHEPTCVGGQRLLTDLSEQEWIGREAGNDDIFGDHGILTRYQLAEAQGKNTGAISSITLLKVWNDRPLTSGYFFIWGNPQVPQETGLTWDNLVAFAKSGIEADPEIITKYGKCRHGYVVKGVTQPGINKDDPWPDQLASLSRRAGHDAARAIAEDHSTRIVVDLINEVASRPDGAALLLGLFGYGAPQFESITIGVPGAPGGASWDTAIGGVLTFNLKGIQPDPRVCFEASPGRAACTATCQDADWSTDLNAYMCRQPLPPAVRGQQRLRMLIEDVDPTGNQEVALVEVEEPASCDPWCTVDLPGGTLLIRFDGPESPAIAVPGSNAPPSGSRIPPPSPSLPSPGGAGGTPPSRVPTIAEIDARLGLRDIDACTGADRFFPQSTAFSSSPFGRRLGAAAEPIYQLAAFATAIPDATAKQAVLREIQARVGDDVFVGVMTQIIGDVQQSRALAGAYQQVSADLSQRIAATGLNRLLPLAPPPGAMAGTVGSWIGASLRSPARVAEMVDLIAGASQVTAECALNQLVRDGFAAAVGAR